MSLDSIDDLQGAEDLLCEVAARALRYRGSGRMVDLQMLNDALGVAARYCRATCQMHGEPHTFTRDDGEDVIDTDNDCGCPCHTFMKGDDDER